MILIMKDIKIIIIDGKSGSGKTTYAKSISENVIHMDDFFLPIELRTPERLSEAGGNVHYERFKEEVIKGILSGKDFSYNIFDCKKMDYEGQKTIKGDENIVIEGAYALHPYFNWDDLNFNIEKVFLDIDDEEQMERIIKRNGPVVAEIFKNTWIPMENKYFNEYDIKNNCKVIRQNKK